MREILLAFTVVLLLSVMSGPVSALCGVPVAEVCDGLDNDCDEKVDEDLGSTACGIGQCQRIINNCIDGIPQECVPGVPLTETCDGLDNDCDGGVDEDLGRTSCGVGECAKTVENCVMGMVQVCIPGEPRYEICDGLDNDCDGIADDGSGDLCNDALFCNGQETCSGWSGCVAGTPVDCSPFSLPGIETCTYSPDDNPLTLDSFPGFTSTCNEEADACTPGTITLTHTLSGECGYVPGPEPTPVPEFPPGIPVLVLAGFALMVFLIRRR